MKHMIYFEDFEIIPQNEGIKNTIATGILATMMLLYPNIVKSTNQIPIDGVFVSKIDKVSDTNKLHLNDKELQSILNEIKANLKNDDYAKYQELFGRLSVHLQKKYQYKIQKRNIENISDADVKNAKQSNDVMKIIGWIGSICLAICGLPQAWDSFKKKNSDGITWGMIVLWTFGEMITMSYIVGEMDAPLLMNYAVNVFVTSTILYYKIYPTREPKTDIKYS